MKKTYQPQDLEIFLELCLQIARRSESPPQGLKKRANLLKGSTRSFVMKAVHELEKGVSLGEFLCSLPGTEEQYIGKILQSADKKGQMVEALEEIVRSWKKTRRFYHTLLQGTLYPLIVLICVIMFFIASILFFETGYWLEEMLTAMPQRIFYNVEPAFPIFTPSTILPLLIALALFLFFLLFSLKTSRFLTHIRPGWLWKSLPVIRKMIYMEYMRLFFTRLKIQLRFHIPLKEALQTAFNTTSYYVIPEKTRKKMMSDAEKGIDLGKILSQVELFEPSPIVFIEESSSAEELTEHLHAIAGHYEEMMEFIRIKLGVWLEPVLLFIIGLALLFALQAGVTSYLSAIFELTSIPTTIRGI